MSFEVATTMLFVPYIALGLIVILILWIIRLEVRIKKLLRGKNAETLEDSIVAIQKDVDQSILAHQDTKKILQVMQEKLKKSIGGVGVVRFNPFKGTSGSNQSFSTAFLDEDKNGVVISSLYSRERVSVFAKPIKNGASEYEITPEEKQAIEKATTVSNP